MALVVNKRFGCCYRFMECKALKKCAFVDDPGFFPSTDAALEYARNCRHFEGGFGSGFKEAGSGPAPMSQEWIQEQARKWLEENPEDGA